MPLPRKSQISLIDTPYYHCVSRCVRRAFLCGKDKYSGKDYEHRRQWVEDRLLLLASAFCIEVCAYAVMSNHVHVVLHVNKAKALNMSDIEVVKCWQQIHKSTALAQQFTECETSKLSDIQKQTLASTISIYRQRLFDISWLMRELNEPIARRANIEDECTGHFWEGRFKSQALLDERALAACMVYVDLNPIRANIESTPEASKHTSIKHRIMAHKKGYQPFQLMPFKQTIKNTNNTTNRVINSAVSAAEVQIPFLSISDYIALVKTTARIYTQSHRVPQMVQTPALTILNIDESTWSSITRDFETAYNVAAGSDKALKQFKTNTNRKRIVNGKSSYI